ncbi:cytochrome c-type biogenesis protein CcmE [Candidatus Rickettsiella viridis]|uniref:Cytochrome c-type biogenesis protein CcmE n=1 Tax=Candidatus Rickettsiella viridis TaxID=676208 RepID=A0A2Z5UU99_9COXI|nr:cytochrome c maturation protein CcmE [Candidatus Rickettsiella viridis]BBB15058.1 cytochrome c-type biogenesis protein CcmE [Candidatus Rickettsiella viridis]
MDAVRRQRLYFSILALAILAVIGALFFYPLKQNFNLFYTPSQIAKGLVAAGQSFHLGGQVKKGTIKQNSNNLQVAFVVSDPQHNVLVEYEGVLPDSFREGQSVVIDGCLDEVGIMQAKRVLIKR